MLIFIKMPSSNLYIYQLSLFLHVGDSILVASWSIIKQDNGFFVVRQRTIYGHYRQIKYRALIVPDNSFTPVSKAI